MKVSVVGQGYVGLNIAIAAARVGHLVNGIDISKNLIDDLSNGINYVPGIESNTILQLIKSKNYIPTTDSKVISNSEIVVIAVPTPLNSERKPDLTFITSACKMIAENAKNGTLIVNESTSYPGTLRQFIKPLIEELNINELQYAAAPERVDPGNQKWNLENTPRIIAGLTHEATINAKNFYLSFCKNVYEVSTSEVAEASKLFENTFRQVNIALANEFSEIADKLDFSASEAINAASTKPFGFMPFFPGIGVGGHCIPVDPSYLSYAAEIAGIETNFINLANKTNLSAAHKISKRIADDMGGSLKGLKVQIAGIAYKTNIADMRESPALLLIDELEALGAIVSWCDELVSEYKNTKSIPITSNIDLGLIVTPHDIIDLTVWHNSGTKVIDLSANSRNFGWPKFL
jgi:UDP-N-acetyl-D-glucosamine dehydrogenase